jgi:PilZ domain
MGNGYEDDVHSRKVAAVVSNTPERRHRPRYRFSAPMKISGADGVVITGISVEMSESGISVMVGGVLKVGERVELEPVAGGKASALVRHKLGQLYGFEFVELRPEHARRIAEICKKFAVQRGVARRS